ncbi:AbrB/MazE/SpoVT family DNA-binding domain-containing protein [Ruficoccus amylovorans]|uniref:AbrB/MazE/SpoVT family DNA-binding domain-containing protein n=1 Tax=Ruficoccus amylovorans TaxID=1804625 RepID=A0A842HFD4_9BACT|nr:AbrB/MazE/SpoVT family DNA-binding domain-containing protein [Ruficoccus amylovorans]MBC2595345.1 AbrB/MazE/SpoVT family DNA-binding domain-containing protein [Ruficoccus amylovorans]
MQVRLTSKRQVTFPRHVVERLGVKAGDTLVIEESADGFLIKPRRFNRANLAPLKDKIAANLPAPDIAAIRHAALDSDLRD